MEKDQDLWVVRYEAFLNVEKMADLPARSMFSPESKADCRPPCFVDKGEAARLPGRLPPHKVSQALRPPPERVGPTPRLLVGFRSDMS